MKVWPVQDAAARFGELLDASVREGPQMVTLGGVETAVLVPIEEWKRLKNLPGMVDGRPARSLKELLLTDEARFDFELPRIGFSPREPVDFED